MLPQRKPSRCVGCANREAEDCEHGVGKPTSIPEPPGGNKEDTATSILLGPQLLLSTFDLRGADVHIRRWKPACLKGSNCKAPLEIDYEMAQLSIDHTSALLDLTMYDTQGLCSGYVLRRHILDTEANDGAHQARLDWIHHIGSTERFGSCNPYDGNFTSLVLPLCMPQRLRLVAYILEFAFLYDNVLESADANTDENADSHMVTSKGESDRSRSIAGFKKMQSKIFLELVENDKKCALRVTEAWKVMVATTAKRENKGYFDSIEEYVTYRIVDTGAHFVKAMMLFGMGMNLTQKEDAELTDVVKPCFAALGLANDYFSFDAEYDEYRTTNKGSITNAVWLFMNWEDVDVDKAKELVKEVTFAYEQEFQQRRKEFMDKCHKDAAKLETYLDGLAYQISGNVVWSLKCPRYHPEYRYDPNAGVENSTLSRMECPTGESFRGAPEDERGLIESGNFLYQGPKSSTAQDEDPGTASCTWSTPTGSSDFDGLVANTSLSACRLGMKHVSAPFAYIKSLPSKGVRDVLADALNVWLVRPEPVVMQVKKVISLLHSASLMLDDIEDSSPLRRGQPATHTLFGIPQTINSANFTIIRALEEVRRLPEPTTSTAIFVEELQNLHVGQSYDLHWTRHAFCPSESEYLEMVDKKTGGLFNLLARLLAANRVGQGCPPPDVNLTHLIILLGRYFQIRDDYQNLISAEYADQKGFCTDLDEGKYSFPVVHALNTAGGENEVSRAVLRDIYQERRGEGRLCAALKKLALEHLEILGSLNRTRAVLQDLMEDVEAEVGRVERDVGCENWALRLLLKKLAI